MAKKNGKFIIYMALAVMSILGSYTLVVLAWGDQRTQDELLKVQDVVIQTQIVTETKARTKLEVDGCKPAQKHKIDVAVINSELTKIQKDMGDFRTENKNSFKEILKEIKKK